jgi:hypothetical protein
MNAQVSSFRNSALRNTAWAIAATAAMGAAGSTLAAGPVAWNTDAGQYEAVQPPAGATTPGSSRSSTAPGSQTQSRWTDLFAYPKAGQSTDQQARDRAECHKWAVEQTGFDPAQPSHDSPKDWAAKRDSYLRAEGACLTARNYSVK